MFCRREAKPQSSCKYEWAVNLCFQSKSKSNTRYTAIIKREPIREILQHVICGMAEPWDTTKEACGSVRDPLQMHQRPTLGTSADSALQWSRQLTTRWMNKKRGPEAAFVI